MKRRHLLSIPLVAVVGLGALQLAAGAFEREGGKVSRSVVFEQTYPGISGQYPEPAVLRDNNAARETLKNEAGVDTTPPDPWEPDTCRTANYCDTIPIELELPTGLGEADDYRVEFRLSWPIDDSANLGIRLWDDGQIKEETGDDSSATDSRYTLLKISTKSGTYQDTGDEVVSLFNPSYTRYNLTINNFTGFSSTEYTIRVTMFIEAFDPPFEILEPAPERPDDFSESPAVDIDDLEQPVESPHFVSFEDEAPGLDVIQIDGDRDFDGVSGSDLESALSAPELDFVPAATVEPDPPTLATLILGLGLVPVLGLVSGGWLLARRRMPLD